MTDMRPETFLEKQASDLYEEYELDSLPSYLQRNSLDYYYLSVYPSLKGMQTMDEEGAILPKYPETINNAYLHTPFCSGACDFCSYFFKVVSSEKSKQIDNYFELVKKEIEYHRASTTFNISYIYFGGGTPSLIPNSTLDKFLSFMKENNLFAPSVHGTLELHPEFFRQRQNAQQFLDILKSHGIQRVSVGFQSSNEDVLSDTNRRHGKDFLNEAISFLRENKMTVNLDLMYGLQGSSNQDWERTLVDATTCKPDSISTYFLFVDPGTPTWNQVRRGDIILPTHHIIQVQHLMAQLLLEASGFHELPNDFYAITQDEPVSFTQQQLPSESNSLPLGAGAYGYYDSTQYYNQFDLKQYKEKVSSGESPIWRGRRLNQTDSLRRDVMFSFKNSPHLSRPLFKERYGIDPVARFPETFELLKSHDLVGIDDENSIVHLTRKGRLCVEEICCLFGSTDIFDGSSLGRSRAEKQKLKKHNFASTYPSAQLPLFDE